MPFTSRLANPDDLPALRPLVDAAIAEVARVLQPGGRFLFFLNHPLLQTCEPGLVPVPKLGEAC